MKTCIINSIVSMIVSLFVAAFGVCFVATGSAIALVIVYTAPIISIVCVAVNVYEFRQGYNVK